MSGIFRFPFAADPKIDEKTTIADNGPFSSRFHGLYSADRIAGKGTKKLENRRAFRDLHGPTLQPFRIPGGTWNKPYGISRPAAGEAKDKNF
jgi:hypothetical protein